MIVCTVYPSEKHMKINKKWTQKKGHQNPKGPSISDLGFVCSTICNLKYLWPHMDTSFVFFHLTWIFPLWAIWCVKNHSSHGIGGLCWSQTVPKAIYVPQIHTDSVDESDNLSRGIPLVTNSTWICLYFWWIFLKFTGFDWPIITMEQTTS